MVKIKFIEKDFKNYKYFLENSENITLNTLRRTINYFLSIYAIDDIEFFENDSVIFDEMLANRIGLCPVTSPLLNTGKKVTFNLEVKGPKTVYTKDFQSNDFEIKMVYDSIPITKLNEGEKLKLIAYANLGQGKEHFKHSPAIVSYSQIYSLDNSRSCEECKKVFEKIKENSLKIEGIKEMLINPKDYDYCVSQVEACDKKCLKMVATNNYILNVELIGQINIKDLFKLTDRFFKENISILKKKLK
jgi:DNA-directed RNA polymerase subunit D